MSIRLTTFAVAVAALFIAVAPALATEGPPPPPPPPAPAPGVPAPQPPQTPGTPGTPQAPQTAPKCLDSMRPTSKLIGPAVRRGPVKALRGSTRDLGCSLTGLGKLRNVQVSIARLKGGRCQFVAGNGKLGAARKCVPVRWLQAKPASNWTLRLRTPLRRGTYLVRIRATDSSHNVEKPVSKRLTIR